MSTTEGRPWRRSAACAAAVPSWRAGRPSCSGPAPAPGRPWVFYAPTFEGACPTERQAWIFSRVLEAGIAVTGIDVGESYGLPEGRAIFDACHEHAVGTLGLARRAVLLPQSRGGLMLYNWAAEHPEKVAGVVGIYTTCDLESYRDSPRPRLSTA